MGLVHALSRRGRRRCDGPHTTIWGGVEGRGGWHGRGCCVPTFRRRWRRCRTSGSCARCCEPGPGSPDLHRRQRRSGHRRWAADRPSSGPRKLFLFVRTGSAAGQQGPPFSSGQRIARRQRHRDLAPTDGRGSLLISPAAATGPTRVPYPVRKPPAMRLRRRRHVCSSPAGAPGQGVRQGRRAHRRRRGDSTPPGGDPDLRQTATSPDPRPAEPARAPAHLGLSRAAPARRDGRRRLSGATRRHRAATLTPPPSPTA